MSLNEIVIKRNTTPISLLLSVNWKMYVHSCILNL